MDAQVPSILDLVFAKSLDFVGDITYGPPLGSSDHVCLLFSCTPSRRYQSTVESRTYGTQAIKQCEPRLRVCIVRSRTMILSTLPGINVSPTSEVSASFIPVRRRKEARAQPPWIDPTGRHPLIKRSRCWRIYGDAPSTDTY
ncbi:unnamed protein product, partial [Dicrocoelium dendriticum]